VKRAGGLAREVDGGCEAAHTTLNDDGSRMHPRPWHRAGSRDTLDRMGLLDKLFGRATDTAGDIADKAAPVVDKPQDAAGHDKVDKASGGQGPPPSAA
jgi:hypothetical protein